MIKWLLVFLIFLGCKDFASAATYIFDYNANCNEAYQRFMSLQLDEGRSFIRKEIIANPYNLMSVYIADYEDCLLLLFNGDSKDYKQRYKNFDERLNILEKGDRNSPWYRLCKAGTYFHWALVQFRFGDNFKAAINFRKSFLLLKENKKLFPDFAQNKIFLGAEEAVVGTIPDDYKWLASIFGMNGNVKNGVAQIAAFINNSDSNTPLRNEAVLFYCYLKFYLLSQQEEVWTYLNSNQFSTSNNLLHSFVKANLALNYRKADAALQVLKHAQSLDGYNHFPVFDYEMGSALLHKLDGNAVHFLKKFVANYSGKLFVKDAWQKISHSYYLLGDQTNATYSRAQIKNTGSAQVDADKQAQRFSEANDWTSISIIKARLLSDGGYYTQALTILNETNAKELTNPTDKLEFFFRFGRIYDELDMQNKAIEFYQFTINSGRTRREHFAARAALQMGMLYEREGKKTEALNRYKECLAMRNHDLQANIDQQAKAGINRLSQ